MGQRKTIFILVLLVPVMLISGLWLTSARWLPHIAAYWLPQDVLLTLDDRLRWQHGGITLSGLKLQMPQCQLVTVSRITLYRRSSRWQLDISAMVADSDCLMNLSGGDTRETVIDWVRLQQTLPAADITINKLILPPYERYAGWVHFSLHDQQSQQVSQQVNYRGDNLQFFLRLAGRQLQISDLTLRQPPFAQPVIGSGELTLPASTSQLPPAGNVQLTLALPAIPNPSVVQLNWLKGRGTLHLLDQKTEQLLLLLPWHMSDKQLVIQQGQWFWPYASQPLSGGMTAALSQWQPGQTSAQFQARINVLTSGHGGRGNMVVSLGPGKLDYRNSQLPVQLTGESKFSALQFYATIPGRVEGPIVDPSLILHPGALVRMRGTLLSLLDVDEARWPLSGVRLSSTGINGRLQAILKAHSGDSQQSSFRLHLDGQAADFWPGKGEGDWRWRYWGRGYLAPFSARWDAQGTGNWRDETLSLDTLSTGFNHFRYGSVRVLTPRLTLKQPFVWYRKNPTAVNGQLQLAAGKTHFTSGGYLPASVATLNISGIDPTRFQFSGQLQARAIGPVKLQGRWDGERLRGSAWWPEQPLTVFQSLLPPGLKIRIRGGTLKAQVAFSAAEKQGLVAGGHWVVKRGHLVTPDSQVDGIDFSLPFRLCKQRWQLGVHGPVSLRIRKIENQFVLRNVTADLQGSWPWSENYPLTLSNTQVELLRGKLSLEHLRLPQRQPALLKLKSIDLSELITAINPRQVAMSGQISGELPLWLNHSPLIIDQGWLANDNSLTLRLDKDTADTISRNNITAGAAIEWLRYLEIARSRATLNLDQHGNLTLVAQVEGNSPVGHQPRQVNLNYTHHENLFQLWRSLRFGDNLKSRMEEHLIQP